MWIMIRIVSGVFLVAIGTGFCMQSRHLDGMLLKGLLLAPGICAIALGLFVFAGFQKQHPASPPTVTEVEEAGNRDEGKKRP